MDVTTADRTTWRKRGRPRKVAPASVVELVRQTLGTDTYKIITIDAGEHELVKEATANLRAAARQLGVRLQMQVADGEIRFYAEELKVGEGNRAGRGGNTAAGG